MAETQRKPIPLSRSCVFYFELRRVSKLTRLARNKKPTGVSDGFSLVAGHPEILNQVSDFLCLTDTQKPNFLTLFNQLEKDMMAIEEFDRFMKIIEKREDTEFIRIRIKKEPKKYRI